MLNDIYLLLPQDITDFRTLNALPENNQGPMVIIVDYENQNSRTSVKIDLVGTPNSEVPKTFIFSDEEELNIWLIVLQNIDGKTNPIILDSNGEALNVYAECQTIGGVTAAPGTLTKIVNNPGDIITEVKNTYAAIVSGEVFENCVDKSTTENPKYQPWTDKMEANQPISTREVITIERN